MPPRASRRSASGPAPTPSYKEIASDGDDFETVERYGTTMRVRKYFDASGHRIVHRKKAKTKKKRGSRRTSGQKGAALEGLLLMPMDVLQMIFSGLPLADLVSLLRTAKPIRRMLLTKSIALVIWRRAFAPLWRSGLPKPPKTLPLPQYAMILSISRCSLCDGKLSRNWRSAPDFSSGLALCAQCNGRELVHLSSRYGRETWPNPDPRLEYILKPLVFEGHWNNGAFLRADVEDAIEYLAGLDPNEEDAMETFNATYADVKLGRKHAKLLNTKVAQWLRDSEARAEKERRRERVAAYQTRSTQLDELRDVLRGEGWTEDEIDEVGYSTAHAMLGKDLDEAAKTKLMRKLENARHTYHVDRAAADRLVAITVRLFVVANRYALHGKRRLPLHVVIRQDAVREEIDQPDPDATINSLRDALDAIDDDGAVVREWRAEAEATLASRLREALQLGEDVPMRQVLDRADAFFACDACCCLMYTAEAIRHCCTDGDAEAMAAKWPLDDQDPLDYMRPLNTAGMLRVGRLLATLGYADSVSIDEVLDGCFVVAPSFRPELTAEGNSQLAQAFTCFDELIRCLFSTSLDITSHIRRVYVNEADAGDDPIALGVCTHGDFRVGPLREVERHLGVVHGQYRLAGETLPDLNIFYLPRDGADVGATDSEAT